MKNFKGLIALFITISGATIFASSIDYRGNQSADFIRTLNRNASLDGADIVVYNPAGTAMMEDGFHINLGNQFVLKEYGMELNSTGTDYVSDYPSLILPNFDIVFKNNNWAVFGGFSIPAGGGTVDYEDGIPSLLSFPGPSLEASSIYYGGTLGGAYAINKMISVSLSGRVIYATKEILAKSSVLGTLLDTKQTALGYGGIIGLDVKPIDNLNIGLRYETITELDFEAETKTIYSALISSFPQYSDKAKTRKDLPALASLGVAYTVIDNLMLETGITYYFIEQANADDAYDDYDNGFDASIGAEYTLNGNLVLSLGYLYSKTGANEDTVNDFDMALDSHNISVGGKYSVNDMIDVSLGYNFCPSIEMKNATKSETFHKVSHTIALGANINF